MNYLTEIEVAKKLRTNKQRVAKWRNAGLLKAVKLSRQWIFRENDVDEFFNNYIGKDLTANHYMHFVKKS